MRPPRVSNDPGGSGWSGRARATMPAILGAGMLQDAGRSAVAVSSMRFVVWAPIVGADDAIILITHTGETAYALAARALATSAGLDVITITKRGSSVPAFGRDLSRPRPRRRTR